MRNDKKIRIQPAAAARTRGRVSVGGVALENYYRAAAFAPFTLDDARAFLGKRANLAPLRAYALERAGELVYPLAAIRRAYNLQGAALRELFAAPLWVDDFSNLVVNAGLDDSLDKHLKGSAYTAAWYIGLTDGTPTPAAGDTMGSHAGWGLVVAYSESVRQTYTLGTVASQSVDNSASPASFSINAGSTTIGGAFVTTSSTKSGTTGTLYGVGAFTGGDRVQGSGDTVNVTVTATAAAV